jgi:polar amino acid transport system substrate-binding protein
MKRILPLLLVVITLLTACQEPSKTEEIVKKQSVKINNPSCELTMGWDPWEPYQYLAPDNQVKGLEIELITSIAKNAGCSLKFVQDDWVHLLAGIKDGTVDILGGASKAASREAFAQFSAPYRHESFVLYVRSGQLEALSDKSLKQLLDNKFRLGVTEEYIYGDEIADIQDDAALASQVVTVPITEVNYYNLTQNQIDGFLEDPFVAAYTIKRKGLSKQVVASNIRVSSGNVSIMFSKKSVKPEIVEAFNKGLQAIQKSGIYEKILKKYRHF